MTTTPLKQIALIILDGWGYSTDTEYNAIAKANPTYFNHLWNTYPHTLLPASGEAVGLPENNIGTSEIGHSIIGAGKILYSDMLRINKAIREKELEKNTTLTKVFDHVQRNNSTLHLLGLVSPGGVHSHQTHLFALLKLAKQAGLTKIAVHVITDGRDTPPQSAETFIAQLENELKELDLGRIATISGRYYAMDRDNNWDRIQKTTDALFFGKGHIFSGSTRDVIQSQYDQDKTDEFIEPCIIKDENGYATTIKHDDGVLFFNFRPDRARQLSIKILEKQSDLNLCFVSMTEYGKSVPIPVLFSSERVSVTLAQEIANAGLTQTHIAETEKYAHVTSFLNGGKENKHENENFILIESRKDIPTHDLAPEMKAKEIADKAIEEIEKGTNLTVLNFANADMVGHTGKMQPTIEAITFLDEQLKRVVEKLLEKDGVALITADHGNAEKMFDTVHNQPYTAHSLNPVPLILTISDVNVSEGTLADIAPTILSLFSLSIPSEMTGKSLID